MTHFLSDTDNIRKRLIVEDPDFVWSYSRLKSFSDCRYGWWLKYIEDFNPEEKFFAQYGTFMHDIIAKYCEGILLKEELATYYLSKFFNEVTASPPNQKVFLSYFGSGLSYLKSIANNDLTVLGVEKEVRFEVDGFKFVGFIDLVLEDKNGNIYIVDHKSRDLKPYTGRAKKTASDKELDEYYKQLYLYSNAIKNEYGRYPTHLIFNCFKKNIYIKEQFHSEKLTEINQWAVDTIKKIRENDDWSPNYDWFRCKYICDLSQNCEYYQMNNS